MENPRAYLDELQSELQGCVGKVCSIPTICRALARLGLTSKKLQHIVMKRSEDSRTTFREEMSCVNANMIVWIDETGLDCHDANRHCGYHLREITPVSHTISIRGKRISVITALSIHVA